MNVRPYPSFLSYALEREPQLNRNMNACHLEEAVRHFARGWVHENGLTDASLKAALDDVETVSRRIWDLWRDAAKQVAA